jgi:ribosomal protein L3 glutamine methyltransferase
VSINMSSWSEQHALEATQQLRTVRDMVRWGASQFNAANLHFGHGIAHAWDEALYLVRYTLHLSPQEDQWLPDARLTSSEREHIMTLFKRRVVERKPAAYLTGEAWFAGLPFYVNEQVIIPRSPIAELIEQQFSPWLDEQPVTRILDLCTGSACIAITCALAFPESQVDAIDISHAALAVAQRNVQRYNLQQRLHLIESDLFAQLPISADNQYNVIVCNPPYVDASDMAALPAEFHHEPTLALAGGEDGLDLVADILQQAADYLTSNGILIVEVGNSETAAITRFADYPLTWLEFERGGQGVFLLTREQLMASRSHAEL